MIELLSTKLYIPRPRANLISRPRLTERLNAGLDRKLTLIAAPAGFGKTTLLSEWIPLSPSCVTWLSLDPGDNDPTRFWLYFIKSIQQLRPDLGEGALNLLQSTQSPPINSILTALINDITAFPDRFSTVLDDLHLISFQPIHEALVFLVDHLPRNMHMVITTRADPPLPLARLRVHDQLNELRANDLRFTVSETSVFLSQTARVSLSAEQVAVLESRTEGWVAGLQIAALSMRDHDDIAGFIQAFSGSHRHLLGYLADEVINQRPRGTLNFLLQTSILDRLCGELCDAVTGDSGGREVLERLEQANLFLTSLDDEGIWYRYHHLFAEVLRARLQRVYPDRVQELHCRAGDWFARHGLLDEAVRHSLAGAEFEQAARWIEAVAGGMLRQGASASLRVWLDAMPDEIVRARPHLCMARGWIYFMGSTLSFEQSERWAQLALQAAQAQGSLDPELTGEVAALRAMIAATRSELALSLQLSRQALVELPPDSPWRSAVAFCLGTAHYLSGDLAAAAPVFEQAINLSQVGGEHFIQTASASFLAETLVFQGRLSRAMELFERVLAWADPNLPQKGGIMAQGGRAAILYERDQLDAALAQAQAGIEQVDRVGGAWSAYVLYRVQAYVQQARGNWVDALEAIDRADRIARSAKVDLVAAQAAALRARLKLAEGDFIAAQAWAANSGLSADDLQASHPGWHEGEYLTLARVLAAQCRLDEALALLDRLLQSADEDRRFGSAIAILALQSVVLQARGETAAALVRLQRALTLARPEGYIRIFVDEGEVMQTLLTEFQSILKQKISLSVDSASLLLLAYTGRLLSAFPQKSVVPDQTMGTLLEPLSHRELEILRLISTGLTNEEIAVLLVIAVSTVKTHINHIYGKLGTHRRAQAVAFAREMGLLSD